MIKANQPFVSSIKIGYLFVFDDNNINGSLLVLVNVRKKKKNDEKNVKENL